MKILFLFLLVHFCFLGVAQSTSYSELKQNLESSYHINIYDKYNVDFFPNYWLKAPYNLKAGDMLEENKLYVLTIVNSVLKEYPTSLICSTIHSVYLLDSVVFSGGYKLPPVYTYNQSIYIISNAIDKDTLQEKFRIGFESVFFDYYPNYKIISNKINDEIKLEFHDCDINEKIYEDFNESSLRNGVNIKINTSNSDIPIFLRQEPYFDFVVGKNNNSIIDVLPILEQAISEYPVVYRNLVNNIYLFPQIYSNNELIPSFSYFSDIYLSVYDTNGIINNKILEELKKHVSKIICQNLLADVSIEKWRDFTFTNIDSNYAIDNDIKDIRKVFDSLFNLKNVSILYESQDSITVLKIEYLKELLMAFYNKLEKVDNDSINQLIDDLKRKYNVNILCTYNLPFQNEGRILPSGLSICSTPNPYQLQRILLNIDSAMSKYPTVMISKYLSNIYIVETMLYSKTQIGPAGTYSLYDKSIYLSNIGATNSSLQKAFHHEFSSLIRELSGVPFPEKEWLAINDSTFSYYYINKNTVRVEEKDLYEQGFLEEYSTTLFDNDVEVFVSWLFYKPLDLVFVAENHQKILSKLRLLYQYYIEIDPNIVFHDDIERLLKY